MVRHDEATILNAFGKQRTLFVLLFLAVIMTIFFRSFPTIDVYVSALFGDANGFSLVSNEFLTGVRRFTINLTKGLAVFLVLLWVYRLCFPSRDNTVSFAKMGFSTVSMVAGPAILTNVILKDNWGRPRPRAIEAFGGEDPFILPWTMSDYCNHNCSFVSGETSAAIWLVTLLPFLPAAWRLNTLVLIGFYTVIVSLLRIAFGGHFLSDVIFSILLNLIVFWFVWGLFFRRGEGLLARDWALEKSAELRFRMAAQWLRRRVSVIFCYLMLAYSALMNKVRRT